MNSETTVVLLKGKFQKLFYGKTQFNYFPFGSEMRSCNKLKIVVCVLVFELVEHLSCVMKKSTFGICEKEDADQLRGLREADHTFVFAT